MSDIKEKKLTLKADAEACPRCKSTGGLAMVDIVDAKTWEFKGKAVRCFVCDIRSTTQRNMHHGEMAWNGLSR